MLPTKLHRGRSQLIETPEPRIHSHNSQRARTAAEKPMDPTPTGPAVVSEKSSFTWPTLPCSAQLFPKPLPSPGMFFPILFHKRFKHISNRCILYSGNSVIFPDDWLTQKLWLVAPKIASVTLHLTIRSEWMSDCRKWHHRRINYSSFKPQPGEK